jgi:hypothetical protein
MECFNERCFDIAMTGKFSDANWLANNTVTIQMISSVRYNI